MTQAVLGAAVGGAVMGRRAGWRAFAWGAVLGTLPDLDGLVPHGGPVADFTSHRGPTHALVVQTLAAPVLAWPLQRLHAGRYRGWLAAVWLVLVTHALLDALTIYGTRLLLPISDRPVGLGSIFIIDPLFTVPLAAGVVAALVAGSDGRRAHRRNALGLALATLYLAWTVAAQQLVESRAEAAIAARGLPVDRMLATPTPLNSVLWRIVAVGDSAHWEGFYTVGSGRPIGFHRYDTDPHLLDGIADAGPVRRLRAFTRGFYAVTERDGRVVITDLRMGQAGYYAFAFTVGRRDDGETRLRPPRRYDYPDPPLGRALAALLACARGEPTALFPC